MASFPVLKSGAVAQYGSARTREFATQVFRFLDGSEQRVAQYGAVLRRWTIRLSLLDEAELAEMESFFKSQAGEAESFAFPDPWDGTVYPNCSFDHDQLATQNSGPARGTVTVTVKENRT